MGPTAKTALLILARQTHAKRRLEFIQNVGAALSPAHNEAFLLHLAEQAFTDDEAAMAAAMEAILSATSE